MQLATDAPQVSFDHVRIHPTRAGGSRAHVVTASR